jgi:hypothetical protein
MSGLTVEPHELRQAAGDKEKAAAEAANAVAATQDADLGERLYVSHGLLSLESSIAILGMATVREEAGRTIEKACRKVGVALGAAAAAYEQSDSTSAGDLNKEMQS